jgi:hypothetical protein
MLRWRCAPVRPIAAALRRYSSPNDSTLTSSAQLVPDSERRARTLQFLRTVASIGVTGASPAASPSAAAAEARDMIAAAVRLQTLQWHHVRRLFAICGELEREQPGRGMWVRMLTVADTITQADARAGDDAADVIVRTRALLPEPFWNALLDLAVDHVVACHARPTERPRLYLESELEAALGPRWAVEPHWWVARHMERLGLRVTSPKALAFLAAETRTSTEPIGREPLPQLSEDAAAAAKIAAEAQRRRAVIEGRSAFVSTQLRRGPS